MEYVRERLFTYREQFKGILKEMVLTPICLCFLVQQYFDEYVRTQFLWYRDVSFHAPIATVELFIDELDITEKFGTFYSSSGRGNPAVH